MEMSNKILSTGSNKYKNKKIGYLYVIPVLIFLLFLTIYPMIFAIYNSFEDYTLTKPDQKSFTGFKNYLFFLSNEDFWVILKNTIVFMVLSIFFTMVIGLSIALIIHRFEKIKSFLIFFTIPPMMVSAAVIGRIWRVMFDYYGPINNFFSNIGIQRIDWLSNPKIALFSVIIVDIWQWTPFVVIILVAGLYALPKDLYEAASLDGAGFLSSFLYITLPLLKPIISIVLLFRIIDTIRVFDTIFVLTKGGPGLTTELVSLTVYKYGIKYFQIGRGSALSIILLIFTSLIIFSVTKLKIFKIEET